MCITQRLMNLFAFCDLVMAHYRLEILLLLRSLQDWKIMNVFFCILCSLAGISRSVTIAAAYIISVTGLSVAEALQAVRSSRTIANPNFGFQKQLHDFEVNGGAQKVSQMLLL